MKPIYALIIPLYDHDAHPGHPLPGQPPGIWGGGNEGFPGYWVPGAPGAPGYKPPGSPPGMWGGSNEPFPGWGLPGPQPGRPGGIWGGGNEPFPTPPIVIPPQKPGDPPLVIWGPGGPGFPTPPIANVPGLPPTTDPPPAGGDPVRLIEWKTAWTKEIGWFIVGIPKFDHVAPAKK